MRILHLCKKLPFPERDGESIINTALIKALSQHECTIDLLAMNLETESLDPQQYVPEISHYDEMTFCPIDNRLSRTGALSALLRGRSYNAERFYSVEFEKKLSDQLKKKEYDLIQLETSYLLHYVDTIKGLTQAPVVLRAHNLEYRLWSRLAKNEKQFIKKQYLEKLSKQLRAFELSHINKVDLLLGISDADKEDFENLGYVGSARCLPASLDLSKYEMQESKRSQILKIGLLGSTSWLPNLEGMTWFVDHVWPQLKVHKNIHLQIAGRGTIRAFENLSNDNCDVLGEVESAIDYIRALDILLVPIFSGSGVRIKILESLAMGTAVLTTTMGKEGLGLTADQDVLLGDSKEAWIQKLQECAQGSFGLEEMRIKGRNYVEHHHNAERIAKDLLDVYKKLVVADV